MHVGCAAVWYRGAEGSSATGVADPAKGRAEHAAQSAQTLQSMSELSCGDFPPRLHLSPGSTVCAEI